MHYKISPPVAVTVVIGCTEAAADVAMTLIIGDTKRAAAAVTVVNAYKNNTSSSCSAVAVAVTVVIGVLKQQQHM
jgi:hypothetical protein